MNINKKYNVVIRKTMMQKEGKKYLDDAAALQVGDRIPEALSFKVSSKGNVCCYDSADKEIANVISTTDSTRTVEELTTLDCDYTAYITGLGTNPSEMVVEVIEIVNEGKKVSKELSAYEDEIERIVSENIMPRADVEENIQIMIDNRFPVGMIKKVLSGYRTYDRPAHKVKVAYADPNPSAPKSILARCTLNALCRCAVNFVGGKSVGKNVCAETIAQIMGMPYGIFTGDNKSSRDDIYGSMKTDNTASEGLVLSLAMASVDAAAGYKDEKTLEMAAEFELLKAKAASVQIIHEVLDFAKTLKYGGVFVVNEWNYLNPNMVAGWLNPVLDGNQFIEIPGMGRVEINPDCVFILCMNDGYTGTQKQNEATCSRMGYIKFDSPKSIEGILKNNFKKEKIDEKVFKQLDNFYKHLIKAVSDDARISDTVLNVRGLVRAIKTAHEIEGFTTVRDQVIEHVINSCPDTEQPILTDLLDEYVNI